VRLKGTGAGRGWQTRDDEWLLYVQFILADGYRNSQRYRMFLFIKKYQSLAKPGKRFDRLLMARKQVNGNCIEKASNMLPILAHVDHFLAFIKLD